MAHIRQRWKHFCSAAEFGEPEQALRNVSTAQLKAFFDWMIERPARKTPQVLTLLQYLRVFGMIYKQITGASLDKEEVWDIKDFIRFHAEGKAETSHRPKPVPSGADVVRMLHFLYGQDTTRYPNERERVQQGFLMITHAFSGLRPSSVTQTRKGTKKQIGTEEKGEEDEGAKETQAEQAVKLRYRDVHLLLSQDEHARNRFAVQSTFSYFKGGKKRPQRKTFTWPDQSDVLLCPAAHLIALALHDNAFGISSLRDAHALYSLQAPSGGEKIILPWRKEVLDKPLLRTGIGGLDAKQLTDNISSKRLSQLGKKMGQPETVTSYWLRRLVLNAVDGFSSDEMRNQVSGHLDSRTYRDHYQDQSINIDIASLVGGKESEHAFVQRLNNTSTNADPKCNVKMPPEVQQHIANLPDVLALKLVWHQSAQALCDIHKTISNTPKHEPLLAPYEQARNRYRAKVQYYKAQWFAEQRRNYFVEKDITLIKAQIAGEGVVSDLTMQPLPTICPIPERLALAALPSAGDTRFESDRAQRAAAVQNMADLCSWEEDTRWSESDEEQPGYNSIELAPIQIDKVFPIRCDPLQCLFCIGNEDLALPIRSKPFCQQFALGRHIRSKHLATLNENASIGCPHPRCKTAGVVLNNLLHLFNHSQSVHGVRLSTR